MSFSIVGLGLIFINFISAQEGFRPTSLLCEYRSNPLGIDTARPRFSWVIQHPERGQIQTAYQILVASSREKLDANNPDKWNSGKTKSDQSVNVVYKGKRLKSGKTYCWKVRVWDRKGQMSPYSESATFDMGLLGVDDWEAEWIGYPEETEKVPLFRKEFTLKKAVARGRVYISGLGFYELYINGKKVGDHVLDPGWTDYDERVLYVTYDVTDFLKEGTNAIGVMLGNGRYNQPDIWSDLPCESPRVILQMTIEFTAGANMSILTDEDWKVSDGPITANGIYYGEDYDARLEKPGWNTPGYDDSDWTDAMLVEEPKGELEAQLLPPIKVVKTIKPVKLTEPESGVWVYDMGQNFTGWVRLKVKGERGTKVVLKFAELLYENGMINRENLRKARVTDVYILKGEGREVYEPRFTYHGFRFVELTGFPGTPTLETIEGRVVHSAVEPVGKFTCSNSLLNQIQSNILWGQLSNLFSVPTDCPQRDERYGWMGDAQVAAEESIYNFDLAAFYTKWLADIKVAQKENGSVPVYVPGRIGAAPAWASAYVLIPWYFYQYYDDRQILEEHYEGMKAYLDFLGKQATDCIVSNNTYGDWCPPGYVGNPPEGSSITSTGYYYYDAWIMSRVAEILGESDDADWYCELADEVKEAFNDKFFYEETSQYETHISTGYRQTSNVFPLFLGIVPEEKKKGVLDNLIENILVDHKGHLDTGILGTKYLMEVLTDCGQGDVAYAIATQTTYPSWGYMIEMGATTIWEIWEYKTGPEMNSHNHIMLGSVGDWFYKALAGIRIDPSGPGYRRIIIKPHLLGGLEWVDASVKTVRGLVASNWVREDDSLSLDITLPVNSEAKVWFPKMGISNPVIKESRKVIWKDGSYPGGVPGIGRGEESMEWITFDVGSGSYSFQLTGAR